MEREIKFKCVLKHDKTGEVVLSKPFTLYDLMNTTLSSGMPEDYLPEMGVKSHFAEFRPVCNIQFTGLHDRNGVEIYEGDISEDVGTVVWNNDNAQFAIDYQNIELQDMQGCSEWFEVIGNIYENPELLKQ